MPLYAALDLHKSMVEAVLADGNGAVTLRLRFPATREALLDFARRHLSPEHRLALEATTNTWPVVALLQPFVAEVVVSNPLRTRAIADARLKTDKVDAETLLHLLRLEYLPTVWVPDPETRQLRNSTTERAVLVADRTRIKNRIHAVLHQRLIPIPKSDLFSNANLRWLATLELDPRGRAALDRHLRHLAFVQNEIETLETELAAGASNDDQVKLLMTLPGVDFTVAQALLAAFGDVSRFPSGQKAAAYLGLVPSTRQSGEHCYHGPITKQGRAHARWLLVQAAQRFRDNPGPLGVFFRKIARKKNRNVAVVACARKLALIAWHMLTHNEPYRYSQPSTTQAKFARLRLRGGGRRKRGGTPKGAGRHPNYGKGGTRAIPALDTIYLQEGLPPIQPLKAGERTMLQRTGSAAYAAAIREPKRIPRTGSRRQN